MLDSSVPGNGRNALPQAGQYFAASLKSCTSATTGRAQRSLRSPADRLRNSEKTKLLGLTESHRSANGHEVHATVIALRYNGGESLAPPRSDLAFEWALAADATLRSLEQRIATGVGPDRQEVDARFDARSDTTEIKVKGSAGEHRISRPGLALIRLGTDRGVLIAQVPKLAAATASPQLVE